MSSPRTLLRFAPLLLAACGDFGLREWDSVPNAGPRIAIQPTGEVRFRTASPYGTPVEEILTIRSAGTEAFTVSDLVITGDRDAFGVGDVGLPARMQPDDELEVTLTFAPDAVGGFSATLTVETNIDGAEATERRLQGQGCNDSNRDGRCDTSGPEPVDTGAFGG